MKGTLHKTKDGWIVDFPNTFNNGRLTIHPYDQDLSYVIEDSDWEGEEIEFNIVNEQGKPYARLVPYISDDSQIGSEVEVQYTKPGFIEKRLKQMFEQASYDELQGVIDLYGVDGTLKMFKEAKPELLIDRIANEEFKKVGDDRLFPNHTDKDIWVNGFKAGFWYHKKS